MSYPKKERQSAGIVNKPDGEQPPPILEPGPIIIKGGSVDINSPIFDFKDDDGKLGRHYLCDRPGRITSIVYRDGNAADAEVRFTSSDVRIVITFVPS